MATPEGGIENRHKKRVRRKRNDAIVKLYRDGYTQEAIGQMFGIKHSQISNITGAKERSERVLPGNKAEITPKHEQVIRQAPKPKQSR